VAALVDCSRTALDLTVPPSSTGGHGLALPMYHFDRGRTGWSDRESSLVPSTVARGLRRAWTTGPLDAATVSCPNDAAGPTAYPPRLFASPLYLDDVLLTDGAYAGAQVPLVVAATTSGWVYGMAAADVATAGGGAAVGAGTIVWQRSVGTPICVPQMDHGTPLGVLGTPVIDVDASPPTLYVTALDATDGAGADGLWRVFALDVTSGAVLAGWPVAIDPAVVSSVDRNAPPTGNPPPMATGVVVSQRAGLALSADRGTLFIGFASYYDGAIGWMVAVDVGSRSIAASFSGSPFVPPVDPCDPLNRASGGMWAAGGPAVASDGRLFMTTGNSPHDDYGTPGVWGNSLLAWGPGLALSATYSPFNYCLLDRGDTDLGGSSPVAFDVDPSRTSTPHLATFGSKQGVVYLVDRDQPGGSLRGREACDGDAGFDDPSTDTSLYGPLGVTAYGGRPGPLPVFGPYSEGVNDNSLDNAKMRTTPAVLLPASGSAYVYVSGNSRPPFVAGGATCASSDAGAPLEPAVIPPCVARIRVALAPGQRAYLEPSIVTNRTEKLVNPGSPIVTSHDGGLDPVVWVLDQNSTRRAAVEPKPGFTPPNAVLYAFDGVTLETLWRSSADDLGPGGKYNHVVVAHGTVYVGTDGIAAFTP